MNRIIKHKSKLIFLSIIVLVLFLRFYRIEQNFIFTGEVGHNLLAIKNAYTMKQIPLLGPPTSHPWLYFGPLYYWIYGPVLILSKFNPLSHAYFGALISTLIVILNYLTMRRMFNERTAIISSYLIAISPLSLEFSRFGRFFLIVNLLVYPFLYYLFEILYNRKNYFLRIGLVFGSLFSFHFTPLFLIPFMISMFILNKYKMSKKSIIRFLTGSFLTMTPFFIYDVFSGLSMTKKVLIWIPYRIAGFLGLYPKNNLSISVVHENSESIRTFILKSFIIDGYPLINLFITLIFLFSLLILCRKMVYERSESPSIIFIFSWLLWGLAAVFIHGSPPIHYFLPVFTAPIIILVLGLDQAFQYKTIRVVFFIVISAITILNFNYYFSDKWYFIPNESIIKYPYYVPYKIQKKIVNKIIIDSKNQKFNLYRSGIYDSFESNYSQNYHFLLWLYGKEPINNSNLSYTIYENEVSNSNRIQSRIIFQTKDIVVTKRLIE